MQEKTINDFIKQLQAIREDLRDKPLVIDCPNGLEVYPYIKMRPKQGTLIFDGEIEKMVITWQG